MPPIIAARHLWSGENQLVVFRENPQPQNTGKNSVMTDLD
jgi:hypothetical protein